MKLTPGKLAGIKAVSNDRGVIAAAAMDQRGSLKKALGAYAGDNDLEEFKINVAEVLTKHASAILLDPEWGLPAAKRRAKGSGLLLAYEKTGYDKALPGRLPDLLDLWSVKRLKEAGADCVKILLYYSTFDDKKINDHKQAWTERIGDECKANDIPFFLELIGYKEGMDEKGAGLRQAEAGVVVKIHAGIHPRIATGSMCMKVEIPVNLQFVEGAAIFQRHQGLLPAGGPADLTGAAAGPPTAVHLPFRRGQQCGVHRGPGVRGRGGREASTACSAAGRRGKTASPSSPRRAKRRFAMAADGRREEHREREPASGKGHALVLHL